MGIPHFGYPFIHQMMDMTYVVLKIVFIFLKEYTEIKWVKMTVASK